jgi:hypothetical protein
MMRKILFFISLFLFQFAIFSQNSNVLLPNNYYCNGETLNFVLRYGFIIGGQANLELYETNNDSIALYHLKGTAKTTGIADKLFHVKDDYESYFDKETSLPVLAIQNIKEGNNYKYYNEVRYNHNNNTIISSKSGEHKVQVNTLDILSSFYYIRRLDFKNIKEGEIFRFNTFFSDAEFPFELRFCKREIIVTRWGKINCLKFAPIVEPGRVFKSKDDMLIWYTDDANRIPIKVTLEMLVGHVTAELRNFSNLKSIPGFKK